MSAYVHCATLAALDEAVFAALLDELRLRHATTTPGLRSLEVRRECVPGKGGDYWWLHIAVVFADEEPPSEAPLEASHGRLARDLQCLALRWGHCWPVLHRHALTERPTGYTAASPGTSIPAPPPAPVRYTAPPAKASMPGEVPPDPEPPPPPVAPAPSPPAGQRSLF